MARIRSDLQIEKGLPTGNKVLAKPDGQTEVVQIEPYKVSPTTWVADDAGIYENTPGQFEIPSLPYAKDVDTVFSRGGKVFKYNSAGGYFELVFDSVGQVVEASETDIATFAANSGNYSFNSGDVVAIPDGGGGYNLFLYNGGSKTDTNSYLPLNVSQVDWSQVNNTPTTLTGYGITDAATSAQGALADTAIQPGDNMSELNDDTDFIDDVIAGDNMTIDKTDPKKPVFYGQSVAVPEYASKNAAIGDLSLGLNYPYSIEGDDTAYVKKDTGFVSTWDTTQAGVSASDEIALPLISGGTYNFDVWYGGQLLKTINTYTDNVITFPDGAGIKEIVCVGQLEGFRFNNGGDKDKITKVEHFGNGFGGTDFSRMFYGCSKLTEVGVLNTSGVTNIGYIVRQCHSLTTIDVSNWDVSSVTEMNFAFYQCFAINTLDVSNWDVSNVERMISMFYACGALNDLPIQNWNIENVTDFGSAFAAGAAIPTVTYDQILTNWSAQNVNPSLNIGFGNNQYSAAGQAGRDDLINNHGWTITDGGLAP